MILTRDCVEEKIVELLNNQVGQPITDELRDRVVMGLVEWAYKETYSAPNTVARIEGNQLVVNFKQNNEPEYELKFYLN